MRRLRGRQAWPCCVDGVPGSPSDCFSSAAEFDGGVRYVHGGWSRVCWLACGGRLSQSLVYPGGVTVHLARSSPGAMQQQHIPKVRKISESPGTSTLVPQWKPVENRGTVGVHACDRDRARGRLRGGGTRAHVVIGANQGSYPGGGSSHWGVCTAPTSRG